MNKTLLEQAKEIIPVESRRVTVTDEEIEVYIAMFKKEIRKKTMNNSDDPYLIVKIALLIIVLPIAIWFMIYNYRECKRFGHTTFYCVTDKLLK